MNVCLGGDFYELVLSPAGNENKFVKTPLVKSASLSLVSLLLVTFSVWAGTPALEGVVKDPAGRPVRGANVRVEAKNFSKVVKTDASGYYISDGLAVGTYKVTLVVNGLVAASILTAKTRLGKPTQLNFDLAAKTVSGERHIHSVWVSTPTGTLIGGTGQWIDVYDDTGLPVDNNPQARTTFSSIERVRGVYGGQSAAAAPISP